MIHRNPVYRDIAIWYDEFLTPGESFRASIRNALELHRKCYALGYELLGVDHPDTLKTKMGIGLALYCMGRYAEALTVLEEAYGPCCRGLGKDHQQTEACESLLQMVREEQVRERRSSHVCLHCGGAFQGIFQKRCSQCGKPKDY